MGLFRQEYWSGLPFLPPGDLPDPGIEPTSPASPAFQADSLSTEPSGKTRTHNPMCIRRNEKVLQKARLYVSKLNYEKIKGVTQEGKENLVLFQGWLVEGFRNSDSSSPEGQSIHSCWNNILSASPSLILGQSYNQTHKLPCPQLLEVAFGVFNN